jgi:hypothetical protein
MAVFNMRQQAENRSRDQWSARRMYYFSCTDNALNHATGTCRVESEVRKAWRNDKLPGYGGVKPPVPRLCDRDVADIPDGHIVLHTAWDTFSMDTLSRQGPAMTVRPPIMEEWRAAPPCFAARFNAMVEDHDATIRLRLVPLFTGTCDQANHTEGITPARREVESLGALQVAGQVRGMCPSTQTGVHIVLGHAGQLWLLSDKDRTIGKHCRLGGFGATHNNQLIQQGSPGQADVHVGSHLAS